MLRSLKSLVTPTLVRLPKPYLVEEMIEANLACTHLAVGVDARASPFVLTIQTPGINVLASTINTVVLISFLSVANSCTFGLTRTLKTEPWNDTMTAVQTLILTGRALLFFVYGGKSGRPLWCVILQVLVGFVPYIQLASSGLTVFNWLLATGSLSTMFIYFSINPISGSGGIQDQGPQMGGDPMTISSWCI